MRNIKILIIAGPLIISLLGGLKNNGWAQTIPALNDSTIQKTDTSGAKTCISCHGNLVEKKLKHNPKAATGCADCHASGVADHPKEKIAVLSKVPDLCLSCHEETKDLIKGSPFVHEALNEKSSCLVCHNPHSSDVKKLLVTNRKDLCLSCHDKSITLNNKTTSNFDKLMKSKTLHPPFEDCEKACHNPHASQDYRLLDLAVPVNNYLPANADSFALCWECHPNDMITKPKSKGTEFRNGETNLHYVHVHGEKGRSCMMCHSPHATNTLHLIRENVKFGSWEFKMNYLPTDSGGSCGPGCHTVRGYTR